MTNVIIKEASVEKQEKVVYQVGQYFLVEEIGCGEPCLCLLARLTYNECNLFNLDRGNRWGDSVECDVITEEVMSDLVGCDHTFTLVKDIGITYYV